MALNGEVVWFIQYAEAVAPPLWNLVSFILMLVGMWTVFNVVWKFLFGGKK